MAVQDGNFATANDQDPSDRLPGANGALDNLLMSVF